MLLPVDRHPASLRGTQHRPPQPLEGGQHRVGVAAAHDLGDLRLRCPLGHELDELARPVVQQCNAGTTWCGLCRRESAVDDRMNVVLHWWGIGSLYCRCP